MYLADFYITDVKFNQKTSRVERLCIRYNRDAIHLGEPFWVERYQVVNAINLGDVVELIPQKQLGEVEIGKRVYVVHVSDEIFLRVDRNQIASDELIDFEKSEDIDKGVHQNED